MLANNKDGESEASKSTRKHVIMVCIITEDWEDSWESLGGQKKYIVFLFCL